MKVQTQTERPFLSLTRTHSFPLYVSVSLFLWQFKPDAMGQGVKKEGDGGSDVHARACAFPVSRYPDMCVSCMHDLVSTKSRDEEGEEGGRLGGKERTCQARSQSSGIEARVVGGRWGWWGARVINLLSFVLSVCFHEALDGTKVKAVSLKIVCLLCSMFSPQGWPSHPWDERGAEQGGEVDLRRGGWKGTEVDPTSLSYQPLRPRLITDYR